MIVNGIEISNCVSTEMSEVVCPECEYYKEDRHPDDCLEFQGETHCLMEKVMQRFLNLPVDQMGTDVLQLLGDEEEQDYKNAENEEDEMEEKAFNHDDIGMSQ